MEEGGALRLPSTPPPSSSPPVLPLKAEGKETGGGSPVIPLPLGGDNGGMIKEKGGVEVEKDEGETRSSSPVPPLSGDQGGMSKEEEKDQEKVADGGLTDELRAQIIRQVEYYFSDENLPTDKFMLKYVKRDKGFVPIGVIASFRKMKKLVKDDISLIVSALSSSTQIVISSDGKKVRRSNPFVPNMKDIKLRTVVVENLAENSTEESIYKMFCGAGKIVNITIQGPNSEEGAKKAMMSNKIYALVEYTSVEDAEKAVLTLNDRTNWRRGIRVELLNKRKGFGKFENFATKDKDSEINGNGNKDDMKDHAGNAKQNKGHNTNRRKYNNQKDAKELGSSSEITNKPLPGPKMPDGTKGFAMGRGKPLKFESKIKEQNA
ncbi:hypothetical protein LUZ60_000723 [Juncus effusus]|nr:hypothetical protein LUZ60_000723 [Juncus effusus]